MKKSLLPLFALCCAGLPLQAATILADTFDYPAGLLYGQGHWIRYGAKESNPIQVTDNSLSFTGYADTPAGHAVTLANINGSASSQVIFRQQGEEAFTGTIFYAALINVESHPSSARSAAIMCLTGANAYDATQFGDGEAGSEGGGLFTRQGTADGTYNVGIGRAVALNGNLKTDIEWDARDLAFNTTHLIVVSYTRTAEGKGGDTMQLWIDPSESDPGSPAVSIEAGSGAEATLADIRGFELSQRSSLSAKMPDTVVDEVRVADSWTDIFHPAGTPDDEPEFDISESGIEFGRIYAGLTYRHTITVTGRDLTGDVTIAAGKSGLTEFDRTVLPKEEVMSEAGAQFTVTLNAADSRYSSETVTLSSEGAMSRSLSVRWNLVPSEAGTTLREYYDEDTHDMNTVYVYTGRATVTFIDTYYDPLFERTVNSIFIEDGTAAVELRSAGGCGYDEVSIEGVSEGDVITDLVGSIIYSDGGVIFVPRTADSYTVAAHGEPLTPEVMTLDEIFHADHQDVMYRLVTVPEVSFDEKYLDGGDYYGIFNSQKYQIYDATGTLGWMWRCNGADYRDQPTEGYFDSVWNLTGIVNEITPLTIGPRSTADFEFVRKREDSSIDSVEAESRQEVTGRYDVFGRAAGPGTRGVIIETLQNGKVRKTVR